MHALARRILVTGAAVSLALAAVPGAHASGGNTARGGKKPLGEIVSFDQATLELGVQLRDGSLAAHTVDADVRVKLVHRGHHGRGRGHGNPSRGGLDDLDPGAQVLRWKVRDGVVEKIRLRPAAASV